MRKRKLAALGGREVTLGDQRRLNAFTQQFKTESDRGAALLAGAYLENALEALLRGSFVEHAGVDKLFDGTGPLAPFSARIDLALALGLINDQTGRELHLIRDIRNDFAHHPDGLTFDNDSVRNRCNSFLMASLLYRDVAEPATVNARRNFLDAVALSYVTLSLGPERGRPVPPAAWQAGARTRAR